MKTHNYDFYYSFDRNDINRESNLKALGVTMAVLASFGALFTALAAWVTHVVVCIKASAWILLIFGIVVPPIGLVHGIGVWFGWFV